MLAVRMVGTGLSHAASHQWRRVIREGFSISLKPRVACTVMHTKLLEIRDRGTTVSALAIRLDAVTEAERYLLARAGYGTTREAQRGYVLLLNLNGSMGEYRSDPFKWDNRTLMIAQRWINGNFDYLHSGEVVDVEFLNGETPAPKAPERMTYGQANGSSL